MRIGQDRCVSYLRLSEILVTEEVCVLIVEELSGLKYRRDLVAGINPEI
jgi:hypothetical protein